MLVFECKGQRILVHERVKDHIILLLFCHFLIMNPLGITMVYFTATFFKEYKFIVPQTQACQYRIERIKGKFLEVFFKLAMFI